MHGGVPNPEWVAGPAMLVEYQCGCVRVWDYPFPPAKKMSECVEPGHDGHRIHQSTFLPPVTKGEINGV